MNLAGLPLPALRHGAADDRRPGGAGPGPAHRRRRPAADVLARRPWSTLAATAAELLLKPALAAACALALGLAGPALLVAVLACALPTATSSYILARLLGGDAELMAALVTTTTLGALLTMPLALAVARALG